MSVVSTVAALGIGSTYGNYIGWQTLDPSYIIPANTLTSTSMVRVNFAGVYTRATHCYQGINIGMGLGPSGSVDSFVPTTLVTSTPQSFTGEAVFGCSSTSTASHIKIGLSGYILLSSDFGAFYRQLYQTPQDFDPTVSTLVAVGGSFWGAALRDPGNTIQLTQLVVQQS